jgi:hypothetical protein
MPVGLSRGYYATFPLLGLREANGIVTNVVDRVPPPEERIAEDSKRTHGFGEVHTHERRDARALDFEDVVCGADGEVVTGKGKRQVGQTVALVALDGVLAVEALLGTDLLVPRLC